MGRRADGGARGSRCLASPAGVGSGGGCIRRNGTMSQSALSQGAYGHTGPEEEVVALNSDCSQPGSGPASWPKSASGGGRTTQRRSIRRAVRPGGVRGGTSQRCGAAVRPKGAARRCVAVVRRRGEPGGRAAGHPGCPATGAGVRGIRGPETRGPGPTPAPSGQRPPGEPPTPPPRPQTPGSPRRPPRPGRRGSRARPAPTARRRRAADSAAGTWRARRGPRSW